MNTWRPIRLPTYDVGLLTRLCAENPERFRLRIAQENYDKTYLEASAEWLNELEVTPMVNASSYLVSACAILGLPLPEGFDPHEAARRLAKASQHNNALSAKFYTAAEALISTYHATPYKDSAERQLSPLRRLLHEVWHAYIQHEYGYTSEPEPGEVDEHELYSTRERDLLAARHHLTDEDLAELNLIIRGDSP